MRVKLVIISIFFSFSLFAQPTVSVQVSPAMDTIVVLPTSSILLTGTAHQANPGHPILDTSWVKTSGPAATITNPSNHMATTVTGLAAGVYVFTLTATDKQNSASASLNVKVLPSILPIELAYFNAYKKDNGIELDWRTDMESNNACFIVQKSENGSGFYDIARIDSKAKNGDSNIQLNYSYQINTGNAQADMHMILPVMVLLVLISLISKLNKVFKSLLLGIACLLLFSCNKSVITPSQVPVSSKTAFRLKQIDLDGNINYSAIKVLN
jgi:hypothetical protein